VFYVGAEPPGYPELPECFFYPQALCYRSRTRLDHPTCRQPEPDAQRPY